MRGLVWLLCLAVVVGFVLVGFGVLAGRLVVGVCIVNCFGVLIVLFCVSL